MRSKKHSISRGVIPEPLIRARYRAILLSPVMFTGV